jgi:predicted amidophosphoribosyltransferase
MTLDETIGGHWIAYTDHQACSCCGKWIAYYENDFNYCPYCGAKMAEGSNEE